MSVLHLAADAGVAVWPVVGTFPKGKSGCAVNRAVYARIRAASLSMDTWRID